jgi:Trypsin-like peptidase domain/Tetratricopeptide repeat
VGRKAAFLMLVLVAILSTAAASQQKPLHDLYDRIKRSVVLLVTFDGEGNGQSLGSGVILAPNGEIVTNLHVIRDAKTVAAKLWNGSFLPIDEVIGIDQKSDLVILKADAQDLPSIQIAPDQSLAVGDSVLAVGNPLGLESALSTGVVSGFRDISQLGPEIQTTAPISPGSSGGGLFDYQGRLVGITSSTLLEGQNLNFAIPVSVVNKVKRFPAMGLAKIQSQLASPGSGNGPRTDELGSLDRAKRFIALEMFDDAEKELASALTENKFNPEAHFYLGDLLARRKSYEKAREEFKIASNLDPWATTPLVRLAFVDMALMKQNGDNALRGEAVRYLRQTKAMKAQFKKDRYSDETTLTRITAETDTLLTRLLHITGEWVTPDGGVWKFTESDGPPGKKILPNTGIVMGNITVQQAYGPTPLTLGFMWRTSELELEGWYAKALPEFKCNASLALHLRESDDAMHLAGTSKVMRPSKPPRGCTYSDDSYPIELQRR